MFSNIGVTQQGMELLAKVHAGQAELKFTKIVMGSGEIPPGKFPRDMTELVTPILDLNITRLQPYETTATVWGTMNSGDVREDFLFREKGLYAADPDHAEGEILYMYGNAGDMAPHIPSGSGGVVELIVGFAIYIGEAEVTAVLASGIYATEVDLQAHIQDEDKHGGGGLTLEDLPIASTEAPGIVQLYDGLDSDSVELALTAAGGKALNDKFKLLWSGHVNIRDSSLQVPGLSDYKAILVRGFNYKNEQFLGYLTGSKIETASASYTTNTSLELTRIGVSFISMNFDKETDTLSGGILKAVSFGVGSTTPVWSTDILVLDYIYGLK